MTFYNHQKVTLDSLREELGGMRKEVEGEKQDLLASLAELTRYLGVKSELFLYFCRTYYPLYL